MYCEGDAPSQDQEGCRGSQQIEGEREKEEGQGEEEEGGRKGGMERKRVGVRWMVGYRC